MCLAIPFKHGVDGLGQLGAAGFVDAACVDPDPVVAVLFGAQTGVGELLPAEEVRWKGRISGFDVCVQDFFFVPCVREDGVGLPGERAESGCCGVEEEHFEISALV